MKFKHLLLSSLVLLSGCRGDIYVPAPEISDAVPVDLRCPGFYLLNEGNMGSNRASIDYFDSSTGEYIRNFYTMQNPNAVKELGDVGNSLTAFDGNLYAVINCSHKVEVMDVATCRRITQIDIPNCRYAVGCGQYLYVSSYVGAVEISQDSPLGAVYKVDVKTNKIVSTVAVGYQPEMMAIVGDRLFVANSGGYRAPQYDTTLSVVNLNTFAVERSIDVGPNLNRISVSHDRSTLYVTSRGNYRDIPARLYAVDVASMKVCASLDCPVQRMALEPHSDIAWAILSNRDDRYGIAETSYSKIDLKTMSVISDSPFDQASFPKIKMPYAIAICNSTGQILLTDARNYVSSGYVHCFDSDGVWQWSRKAGDIPADILFTSD